MQSPFPQRFGLAPGPHEASFHAPSTKIELSMGPRFGRNMAGFTGMGTVELVPAGLRIVARRYRYKAHVACAAAAAVVATVVVGLLATAGETDPHAIDLAYRGAAFWGVVAALIGAWIASACTRFFTPVTALLDRTRIEHVQMVGPRLRIFSNEGDVELWIPKREDLQGFLHALGAAEIAMR